MSGSSFKCMAMPAGHHSHQSSTADRHPRSSVSATMITYGLATRCNIGNSFSIHSDTAYFLHSQVCDTTANQPYRSYENPSPTRALPIKLPIKNSTIYVVDTQRLFYAPALRCHRCNALFSYLILDSFVSKPTSLTTDKSANVVNAKPQKFSLVMIRNTQSQRQI